MSETATNETVYVSSPIAGYYAITGNEVVWYSPTCLDGKKASYEPLWLLEDMVDGSRRKLTSHEVDALRAEWAS